MTTRQIVTSLACILFSKCLLAQSLWSDPSTWPNGIKPTAGQSVTIPMGTTIILDENTPALGGITVLGKLEFARQDLALNASWIMVHGILEIGTSDSLFTQKAILTLTGEVSENAMGMGSRGIMVMGGKLELHGATPALVWTKLNQHAPLNATTLFFKDNVNWNVGDEIAVAPTDYYQAGNGSSVTQRVSITNQNENTVTIDQGLNAFRWGRLQYATSSGMSLDSADLVASPIPDTDSTFTPKVLDERAAVGNLTRNIVIEAPNDVLWVNQGFGVHVMIMGTGAEAHVEGVEIRRGGQRNRLGRYPFHWHMLSYSGSVTLPDATGQYFRNSSVNSSTNRGIVIHGTNGVTVKNNVVYDITGHGIFTEDAVERRNVIDSNLVMHVRNTYNTALPPLKVHESNASGDFGSSGFWISNPDNTLTNNIAADCNAFGFWLAFTTQPWGESINVLHSDGLLLNPSRLRFGVFDNNTAHSNRNRGIMLDLVENSNAGTVIDFQYWSTTNGRQPVWPNSTLRRFTLSRYKVWKNGQSGIWDRAVWPNNIETVSADNCGRFYAGSGSDGIIERSLVVGTSLNHLMNGTDRPVLNDAVGGNQTPAAFATYHSSFDIRNNLVINFPEVANTRSGAFATEDYYLRPVEKGQIRNVNNVLIQSHVGVKLPALFEHYGLAGALWDPNGNWRNGVVDTNSYFVYNTPFFTHGQTPTIVAPGAGAGGVLVHGPFYGINDFEINRSNDPQADLMAIQVKRLDHNFDSVGNWAIGQAGDFSWILSHMRHAAVQRAGIYQLNFPTINAVTDVAFTIENMLSASDSLVIGIEYSGQQAIDQIYISSFPNFMGDAYANWPTSFVSSPSAGSKLIFQPVNNRQAVLAASGYGAYWHDRTNNVVWVKIKGGIPMFWNEGDYGQFSDEKLYRRFGFRIYGQPGTTWTGAVSHHWNDAANWSNGVPGASSNVNIPLVATMPTLATNTTIRSISIDSGAIVTNLGQLNITGSFTNHGSVAGAGTTLLNGSNGLSQVIYGSGTVANMGLQNSAGVSIYGDGFSKLNIGGTLHLSAGTFTTNNNMVLQSNVTITGSQTIDGDVANPGTLAPGNSPGTITINGNYTASSTSKHYFEIGGASPGAYDRLDVQGTAILDGEFTLSFLNGFVPASTDSIILINGTISGRFAVENLPNGYLLVYSATSVALKAVSVLPVTFLNLFVHRDPAGIKLIWNVAEERNVLRYEVERSDNGNIFERIGAVAASRRFQYSFTTAPPQAKVHFRIKSVDLDGTGKYSPVVTWNPAGQFASLRAVPVPAVDKVMLLHPAAAFDGTLTIVSLEGRTVMTVPCRAGSQQTSIDISTIQSGTYIMRFVTNTDFHLVRFIKR